MTPPRFLSEPVLDVIDTPHLALPLIAAAQAQKHVTHNEALAALDALVQLAVKERGRTAPPASPAEGDRYLVGAGATGAFAGQAGHIALFDLGAWRFFTPRPGWLAYVEAEDLLVVFDGAEWKAVGAIPERDPQPAAARPRHGGRRPEPSFREAQCGSVRGFVATAEGGTGDLRFVLNKSAEANVLSQLYQRAFSGRAETGLIGSDDFRIRVSPDGSQWRDALLIDRATGIASFPCGVADVPRPNLLVNAAFLVNQRRFAGGPLAAGSYGFDRWRAGPSAAARSTAPPMARSPCPEPSSRCRGRPGLGRGRSSQLRGRRADPVGGGSVRAAAGFHRHEGCDDPGRFRPPLGERDARSGGDRQHHSCACSPPAPARSSA